MFSNIELQKNNAIVVANAAQLVSDVVRELAGNDVSNSINGSRISNEIVCTLAQQRIDKKLSSELVH